MPPISGDDGFSGLAVPPPGTYGVLGDAGANAGDGVVGLSGSRAGVYGESNKVADEIGFNGGIGVYGVCRVRAGTGVAGEGPAGVSGTSTDPNGIGVGGSNPGGGAGVYGYSGSGAGVSGVGESGAGVHGESNTGNGLVGMASPTLANAGLYSAQIDGSGNYQNEAQISTLSYAGLFHGDVFVEKTLHAGVKGFRIDHPADPANQYLEHASVESSDRKNVYDGIAELGDRGQAEVELPRWFGILNGDFRYQLTCLGEHAPVFIVKEVEGNRFQIAGGRPGLRVSWQITGIRRDPLANAHPLVAEAARRAAGAAVRAREARPEGRRAGASFRPAPGDAAGSGGHRRPGARGRGVRRSRLRRQP
jgi:hypothetical protein